MAATLTAIGAGVTALIGMMVDVIAMMMDTPYAIFVYMAVLVALIKGGKKLAPSKR